ncbi:hypothetical protein Cst04h_19270 [Corynebacterium striatum]|uniref:Transposase n=1 Tax=Corynebacterium striatum TaxID=43770 RepID=A0ABC9ZNJ7_CORST|nr:hypothetical protein Cst04h_19270 [Corynebacterium striatum]
MSGLLPDDATPVWCGYRKYEREEMCSATRYSLSCYRIVTTLLPNSRSQQITAEDYADYANTLHKQLIPH